MGTSQDSDGFIPGLQGEPDIADAVPLRMPGWLWSLLALALGVAISYWVADRQQARVEHEQRAAFIRLAEDGQAAIVANLHACEMLLRSVQTVFLASEEVNATEFANIYKALKPRAEFPSLQALAYAQRTGETGFVSRMVEPVRGNERVFGLDLADQPANLAAALASRDSNQVAMSGPFRLVQLPAAAGEGDGVTMRLPIYSSGAPPVALGERRARMLGSIAASFHVHRLIADAIPPVTFEQMHIVVSDITQGDERLLYDSRAGAHADAPEGENYVRDLLYGDALLEFAVAALGEPDFAHAAGAPGGWRCAPCNRRRPRSTGGSRCYGRACWPACCWRCWCGRWPPRGAARWSWAGA